MLEQLRTRYMSERKVICTGNPDQEFTIASAVKKHWPNATFLSRSTGYDLTNINADQLSTLFKTHNTFINASYINDGVQSQLLELCNQSAKFYDVFNIGSTHEYDNLGLEAYKQSKVDLREKSLALHTYRFQTCHMVVGGIKRSHESQYSRFLDVDEICEVMQWVLAQRFWVPIISMTQPKQAW